MDMGAFRVAHFARRFFVITLTLVILPLLIAVGVATLIFAARSASEGFEDDGGFHRVKVAPTVPPADKKQLR